MKTTLRFYLFYFLAVVSELQADDTQFNTLSNIVLQHASADLLPSRKILADQDNLYFDLNELQKSYPTPAWELYDSAGVSPLAKFNSEQRQKVQNFLSNHSDLDNKFRQMVAKKCLVPDSVPMLVQWTSADVLYTKLAADLIQAMESQVKKEVLVKVFFDHLSIAKSMMNCEGGLIFSIIGLNYAEIIQEYASELRSLKKLSSQDASLIAKAFSQLPSDISYVESILRIEYRYSYLVSIETARRDLLGATRQNLDRESHFLLDIPATMSRVNIYFFDLITALREGALKDFHSEEFEEFTDLNSISKSMFSKFHFFITWLRWPKSAENYLGRLALGLVHRASIAKNYADFLDSLQTLQKDAERFGSD